MNFNLANTNVLSNNSLLQKRVTDTGYISAEVLAIKPTHVEARSLANNLNNIFVLSIAYLSIRDKFGRSAIYLAYVTKVTRNRVVVNLIDSKKAPRLVFGAKLFIYNPTRLDLISEMSDSNFNKKSTRKKVKAVKKSDTKLHPTTKKPLPNKATKKPLPKKAPKKVSRKSSLKSKLANSLSSTKFVSIKNTRVLTTRYVRPELITKFSPAAILGNILNGLGVPTLSVILNNKRTLATLFENNANKYIAPILGSKVTNQSQFLSNYIISRKLFVKAPGIMARAKVQQPMYTGLISADNLTPIARGQRSLIIGDPSTGKTTIALESILSARRSNLFLSKEGAGARRLWAVYVSIGKKRSGVFRIMKTLTRLNAFWYSTIIAVSAEEPAGAKYLSAYTGTAIGEFFRDNGMDSLLIYDDLTEHSNAFRQICLLQNKLPSREAYPCALFRIQAGLLERACQLTRLMGNGTLTTLPIVETQNGNVNSLVPTSVISITDGQIFTETLRFEKLIRPAFDFYRSVSRVGQAAQRLYVKASFNGKTAIKSALSEYELLRFWEVLDVSQLSSETQKAIYLGKALWNGFIQPRSMSYSPEEIAFNNTFIRRHGLINYKRLSLLEFNKAAVSKYYTTALAPISSLFITTNNEMGVSKIYGHLCDL